TFYIYVKLTAGSGGFKFLNQQQWPGGSLNAADWGMKPGSPGDAVFDGESNIEVYGATGVYRVTFDQKNLKYYVQADHGRMGAVGGATVAGWDPPAIFPSQALGFVNTNKFLGLVTLKAGEEWKLIDGNAWGNGSISGSRDYGKGTTAGSMLEANEGNFTGVTTTGLKRIIWDGTDIKNLKYSVTDGSVFLVGNATAGGWDNSASNNALPAMTYEGNGKWTVTANLTVGEFKFIVTKGSWDFDYGGSDGKISNGGANLAITTAGNYTVKIDEYNQTYTVTKN
ncbi:MAG: SusF/SusE family outer membrane protein, partial [Pedobacter sp.]